MPHILRAFLSRKTCYTCLPAGSRLYNVTRTSAHPFSRFPATYNNATRAGPRGPYSVVSKYQPGRQAGADATGLRVVQALPCRPEPTGLESPVAVDHHLESVELVRLALCDL
eukprot:scaffold7500_cov127-Isochrysis_galbana.AAC.22